MSQNLWKRPQAKEDLINIWSFISEDSHHNADRFLDLLEEKCQILASNPLMGRSREELIPNL